MLIKIISIIFWRNGSLKLARIGSGSATSHTSLNKFRIDEERRGIFSSMQEFSRVVRSVQ